MCCDTCDGLVMAPPFLPQRGEHRTELFEQCTDDGTDPHECPGSGLVHAASPGRSLSCRLESGEPPLHVGPALREQRVALVDPRRAHLEVRPQACELPSLLVEAAAGVRHRGLGSASLDLFVLGGQELGLSLGELGAKPVCERGGLRLPGIDLFGFGRELRETARGLVSLRDRLAYLRPRRRSTGSRVGGRTSRGAPRLPRPLRSAPRLGRYVVGLRGVGLHRFECRAGRPGPAGAEPPAPGREPVALRRHDDRPSTATTSEVESVADARRTEHDICEQSVEQGFRTRSSAAYPRAKGVLGGSRSRRRPSGVDRQDGAAQPELVEVLDGTASLSRTVDHYRCQRLLHGSFEGALAPFVDLHYVEKGAQHSRTPRQLFDPCTGVRLVECAP